MFFIINIFLFKFNIYSMTTTKKTFFLFILLFNYIKTMVMNMNDNKNIINIKLLVA